MSIELERKVKAANKEFYNLAFDIYEKADGRRSKYLDLWIRATLERLSKASGGDTLLDLGCGTGVVLKNGGTLFSHSYGIDIAEEVLKNNTGARLICADGSCIPIKPEAVDVAVCFSVLHHIYDYKDIFSEVHRVLKKGGFLYIDHDIDRAFVRRFYPLLKAYRYIFNPANKYIKFNKSLTKELYKLSEIHSGGIDSDRILAQLKEAGFRDIKVGYHWFGLNKLTNAIFRNKTFKKGLAPLVYVLARK